MFMRYGFVRRISTLVRVAGVAALVLVPAAHAAASSLTYNEAVSGDLAWHPDSQVPLDFGIGVNTVTGHTFADPTGFDWDSFVFSIPSGAQLTDISVSYASTWTPTTQHAELDYGLHPGTKPLPGTVSWVTLDLFLPGGPGAVLSWALPLGPGVYSIDWMSAGYGGFEPVAFYSDYTWSFTVAGPASAPTVPEPASLMLLGTGLIAVGRRFRRRS
jgi:hypothetical protein